MDDVLLHRIAPYLGPLVRERVLLTSKIYNKSRGLIEKLTQEWICANIPGHASQEHATKEDDYTFDAAEYERLSFDIKTHFCDLNDYKYTYSRTVSLGKVVTIWSSIYISQPFFGKLSTRINHKMWDEKFFEFRIDTIGSDSSPLRLVYTRIENSTLHVCFSVLASCHPDTRTLYANEFHLITWSIESTSLRKQSHQTLRGLFSPVRPMKEGLVDKIIYSNQSIMYSLYWTNDFMMHMAIMNLKKTPLLIDDMEPFYFKMDLPGDLGIDKTTRYSIPRTGELAVTSRPTSDIMTISMFLRPISNGKALGGWILVYSYNTQTRICTLTTKRQVCDSWPISQLWHVFCERDAIIFTVDLEITEQDRCIYSYHQDCPGDGLVPFVTTRKHPTHELKLMRCR
jgi:hypothetical protein